MNLFLSNKFEAFKINLKYDKNESSSINKNLKNENYSKNLEIIYKEKEKFKLNIQKWQVYKKLEIMAHC